MSRLLLLVLAGCTVQPTPHLEPDAIAAGTSPPVRIVGLPAASYLATAGASLVLVDDYRAELGGTAATVTGADATGVTVSIAALPAGRYALDLEAGGHAWHVDDALVVTGAPPGVDAGIDGVAACPAAPLDCVALGCATTASCYYLCDPKSFEAGDAQCENRGLGFLATIDDAAEQACLAAATGASAGDPVWIGYAQASGSSEPAGGWTWESGATSTFTAWQPGQPDDAGKTDCAALVGSAWDDLDCSTSARYLCELAR